MTPVKVKPHSLDLSALEATERTFKALRGGGQFARTPDGLFLVDGDGFLTLECEDAAFILWAAVRQGYVLEAKKP